MLEKNLNIRIEEKLRKEAKKVAKQHGYSFSGFVREAIKAFMKKFKKQAKK